MVKFSNLIISISIIYKGKIDQLYENQTYYYFSYYLVIFSKIKIHNNVLYIQFTKKNYDDVEDFIFYYYLDKYCFVLI